MVIDGPGFEGRMLVKEGVGRALGTNKDSAVPIWLVVLLVLCAIGCASFLTFLFWRRRERVLREECADMLAEYMPMDDSGQVC